MSRKICVVVASRANYGRIKSVMKAIVAHPELELQLIIGASTLLERFGRAINVIKDDGFEPDAEIYYVVEGETLATQAKSTGLGVIELTTAFERLTPDVVITVADRFETMATAIAATYLNIPLAHVQGGEISGNIDDRVRHAITKLADIHFACTEESKKRILRMGEEESFVFNSGCPAMDTLKESDLGISNERMSVYGGVGVAIDWTSPYILVVQHPVTTSYGDARDQISETLEALKTFDDYQKVVLWPNIDAGSDDISKGIRVFRENNMSARFHYFKNFSPIDYACVLANASCCIGNSSSFIREGAFLGVPSILVGDRQQGRETGSNVVNTTYGRNNIIRAILEQLEHGAYTGDPIFGNGGAGEYIANILSEIDLSHQKRNAY